MTIAVKGIQVMCYESLDIGEFTSDCEGEPFLYQFLVLEAFRSLSYSRGLVNRC